LPKRYYLTYGSFKTARCTLKPTKEKLLEVLLFGLLAGYRFVVLAPHQTLLVVLLELLLYFLKLYFTPKVKTKLSKI